VEASLGTELMATIGFKDVRRKKVLSSAIPRGSALKFLLAPFRKCGLTWAKTPIPIPKASKENKNFFIVLDF